MLPKIVVASKAERELIRESLKISVEKEIGFDGTEATIKDFREWLNFATNICKQNNEYSMVIWNADSLKSDCQNVLLKPLEEKPSGAKYFLIVNSEKGLLETIISRCETEKLDLEKIAGVYWSEVVRCWKEGPARCIVFAEKIKELSEVTEILREVVQRLGGEIRKDVKQKRIEILDLSLKTLEDLDEVRVNPRLCLEDFLIQSWIITKT